MDLPVNANPTDRKVRAGVSAASALAAVTLSSPKKPVGIVLLLVSAVMGVTAATGFCPLWKFLGVNTNA